MSDDDLRILSGELHRLQSDLAPVSEAEVIDIRTMEHRRVPRSGDPSPEELMLSGIVDDRFEKAISTPPTELAPSDYRARLCQEAHILATELIPEARERYKNSGRSTDGYMYNGLVEQLKSLMLQITQMEDREQTCSQLEKVVIQQLCVDIVGDLISSLRRLKSETPPGTLKEVNDRLGAQMRERMADASIRLRYVYLGETSK